MILLRQSTDRALLIGPFLTSAGAASTGLTVSQADVRLSKNAADMAGKNSAGDATHDELGWYLLSLNPTDTNTLGLLQLMVTETGALPVWHEYEVVTANIYDTMFSTDRFDTNLAEVATGIIMASAFTAGAVDSAALGVSLADILADTNELQGDWTNGGRLDLLLDSILLDTGTSLVTMLTAQDVALASLLSHQVLVEADTNELQGDWTDGGRLDLLIDAILLDTGTSLVTVLTAQDVALASLLSHQALIEADTNELQVDDVPGLIAALNDLSAAAVNVEVVDALATDTYAEPGAGAPAATTTFAVKLGSLYQFLRNRKTATVSLATVYLDDAVTSAHTAIISDNGTVFDHGEWGA